jgi:hypothetical protein
VAQRSPIAERSVPVHSWKAISASRPASRSPRSMCRRIISANVFLDIVDAVHLRGDELAYPVERSAHDGDGLGIVGPR